MTKKVEAKITCPNCDFKKKMNLYSIIWGENPIMRKLVFDNEVNMLHCDSCKVDYRLPFHFMYVNLEIDKNSFVVWYDPTNDHDGFIANEKEEFRKNGYDENNMYITAPQISNWEEFKEIILKFEKGLLKANNSQRKTNFRKHLKGYNKK